jgi:hypothetical protein
MRSVSSQAGRICYVRDLVEPSIKTGSLGIVRPPQPLCRIAAAGAAGLRASCKPEAARAPDVPRAVCCRGWRALSGRRLARRRRGSSEG